MSAISGQTFQAVLDGRILYRVASENQFLKRQLGKFADANVACQLLRFDLWEERGDFGLTRIDGHLGEAVLRLHRADFLPQDRVGTLPPAVCLPSTFSSTACSKCNYLKLSGGLAGYGISYESFSFNAEAETGI